METKKLIIGAGALVLVIALVAVSVTLGLMAAGGSDSDAEIVSAGSASQVADTGSSGARRPAGRVMETVIDDGNGPVASRIEILPSPNLPDAESETSGVFLRRVDNSVFVGTGSKGAGPLIFQRNGTPYRGFLEGRVDGDGGFLLVLHLSNMELKPLAKAEGGAA